LCAQLGKTGGRPADLLTNQTVQSSVDIMESFHQRTLILHFRIHWPWCPCSACTAGFRFTACHHSVFFLPCGAWRYVSRNACLRIRFPSAKTKPSCPLPSVFNADKVMEEEEETPGGNGHLKITGMGELFTPRPARGQREAEAQQRYLLFESATVALGR
jgi:hypothetical protein